MSRRYYRDLRPTFADRECWTLPWILRTRAKTHGERVFLDVPDDGERFTYREMLELGESIGSGLLAVGAEPGDRVLIMSPNRSEIVLAWFGSALAGLVQVPINTAYIGSFLEHQVRTTQPRIAVVHASMAERFADGDEAYSSLARFYVIGEGREIADAIELLRRAGFEAEAFDSLRDAPVGELPEALPSDLTSILFTSGTTGLSKGVMMSHAHCTFFADETVSLTRLTDEDVYMSVGPLFHSNASYLALYPALIAGARFVLCERFSPSRWIDQVRACGATVTNFVGVMMDWTWKQPERPDDADNKLRCIFSAPTASSILDGFKRRFGVEAFVEVFGLTETCMPILAPYGEDRPPGAAGLLADEFFDARLVDPDTDEDVEVGGLGELLVRTRLPWTITLGYYNMPERTVETWQNLWFHTGDGLRMDEDGWFYFVDRLKDAMRRRGENISSYEVEQAVLGHEAIAECSAVAAPALSEAGEDEVAIFVVLQEEGALTTEEVRDWCRKRLPAFAMPEYVAILDELPMTPSGKVRKVELREIAAGLAKSTADAPS